MRREGTDALLTPYALVSEMQRMSPLSDRLDRLPELRTVGL